MAFEPIAIVGRACVLPGAHSPEALWRAVLDGRDLIASAPAGSWGGPAGRWLSRGGVRAPETAWTDRGGYVSGFSLADAPGITDAARAAVEPLDPVFGWLLAVAAGALAEAKLPGALRAGTGLIAGNLSYPTPGLARYASAVWRDAAQTADPRDRFQSGYPVQLAASALGLGGPAFALDAACASGLYALKLACDALHDRAADAMLAAAVNRADDLFLHIGFSELQALSPSGRSRPFHQDADGLLPAEGAACVVLKRLADAERANDPVFAVIRGIGLSNDGRRRGLLAPDRDGQVRAMEAAYAAAALDPAEVGLVECHATGTAVGDRIEIESMARVFAAARDLPVGSLKSNLGHLITVAGLAGLLKAGEALRVGVRPITLHAAKPNTAFADTSLRPLLASEPWPADRPRLAGVSAFGFGGNNAHVVLEAYRAPARVAKAGGGQTPETARPRVPAPVAVTAIGLATGAGRGAGAFERHLFAGRGQAPRHRVDWVELALDRTRFPPADLEACLGQQTLLLQAAMDALDGETAVGNAPTERVGVLVGMGCDPEIARHGFRWRAWDGDEAHAPCGALNAARVTGTMPNIVANRLNTQFDARAFGFAISAEELSGLAALRVAARALDAGEIDVALIGAVEVCGDAVHELALRKVTGRTDRPAGDAAVVLVLRRGDDPRLAGDPPLGRITFPDAGRTGIAVTVEPGNSPDADADATMEDLSARFGDTHAASGLLAVAAGLAQAVRGVRPGPVGAVPVAVAQGACPTAGSVDFRVRTFAGRADALRVTAAAPPTGFAPAIPFFAWFGAGNAAALARRIAVRERGGDGPVRLFVHAPDPDSLERRLAHAHEALVREQPPAGPGIAFANEPLEGEVAFVFTGAAGSYGGMARELLAAFPDIHNDVLARFPLHEVAERVFDGGALDDPFDQLRASVLVCQAHALFAENVLGLEAAAVLGVSSGETNALFWSGLWREPAALFEAITASEMYGRHLTGACESAARAWGTAAPVRWQAVRLRIPLADVRARITGEPRVHVAIVYSDRDAVIAGDAEAVQRVVVSFSRDRAIPVGHAMVVHCAELEPFARTWRRIHSRTVHPARVNARLYSNTGSAAYRPTTRTVADRLTRQALGEVNFARTVRRAWDDGVRVFVEMGPRQTLTGAVRETLDCGPHLAVALDGNGASDLDAVIRAAGQLYAVGALRDPGELAARLDRLRQPFAAEPGPRLKSLRLPVRMAPVPRLTEGAPTALASSAPFVPETMPAAPALPPVRGLRQPAALAEYASPPLVAIAASPAQALDERARAAAQIHQRATDRHRDYLTQQQALYRRYLAAVADYAPVAESASSPAYRAAPPPRPSSALPLLQPPSGPPPLMLSRAELERLAQGRIADVLGPAFGAQDAYARQVRLPEPPLLLVDRVLAIEGTPGTMGLGRIVTETDVAADAWYLHNGRVPAGIFIECGQADLLLISWLGADLLNKGERVYRLLGCEVTFHAGGLPRAGETIRYDIEVTGHARTGDVRLFFFRYEGRIGGRPAITVREGQAGFFSDDELARSGGVLWRAEDDTPLEPARVDPPAVPTSRRSFDAEAMSRLYGGDAFGCFGPGFEMAAPHHRTPTPAPVGLRLLDSVAAFDPAGGPWRRGYLRATARVPADAWFYAGHFKNDPCMPGTLMADAALQAMAFYLAASGHTVKRDGWRFEPVAETPFRFLCRGQVVPDREHELTYEVFVEELIGGDEPVLWAALLCRSDDLKVFHCRRFGVRLVPDWPIGKSLPDAPGDEAKVRARPVGTGGDVRGDGTALLACALGAPSDAFGTLYAPFDGSRRVPRLPAPPYHFISRIENVDGRAGEPRSGASLVAAYDVPGSAWYFDDNGTPVMPFAVLMEVLLQPCGWLASFLGFAIGERSLVFRNLDGDGACVHRAVAPACGTIESRVRLTRYSKVGDMTLVFFRVESTLAGEPLMEMNTSFGFFAEDAMARQAGLPVSKAMKDWHDTPGEIDLDPAQTNALPGKAALGAGKLRLIDRITGFWPDGGEAGLGRVRGRQGVDPRAWYFSAHFFQDPVQPGSLGLEALIQLLECLVRLKGLDTGFSSPVFEAPATGEALVWKYRGQVVPTSRHVTSDMEITGIENDERGGLLVRAGGSLWVDGLRIYAVENLAVRVREAAVASDSVRPAASGAAIIRETVLDPAIETWVRDHCPTYTVPALPMTVLAERLAAAAAEAGGGRPIVALEDVRAFRWAVIDGPVRLRTAVRLLDADTAEASLAIVRDADRPAQPIARARVRFAEHYPDPPQLLPPLEGAAAVPDPYADGSLFHGPAFRVMDDLRRAPAGASFRLDGRGGGVPRGCLNPGLLDGLFHGVPHDRLDTWFAGASADRIGYPLAIDRLVLHGPAPSSGLLRAEVRVGRFEAAGGIAHLHGQVIRDGRPWASMEWREATLPKGPLGRLGARERRAFLSERTFEAAARLSAPDGDDTVLAAADVAASNWLPGTIETAYGCRDESDFTAAIAAREHVAHRLNVHPVSVTVRDGLAVAAVQPLNLRPLTIARTETRVRVSDAGPTRLDLARIRALWRRITRSDPSPVEDLYVALLDRFTGTVTVSDPEALDRLRARPFVFLSNHQTGIESPLFALAATCISGRPVVTLAKREHQESWMGDLIAHCEAYPGIHLTRPMIFFDRNDPASMLALMNELRHAMATDHLSLMVHVEGTRALACRTPVQRVSSVFLDLALQNDLPIVPVRFSGGLPVAAGPDAERQDFPLGFARQDIHIGRPLMPDDLRRVMLAERKRDVLAAINDLGPDPRAETPNPGDAAFVAAVDRMARQVPYRSLAVIAAIMAEDPAAGPELRRAAAALESGGNLGQGDAEAMWLGGLIRLLRHPY